MRLPVSDYGIYEVGLALAFKKTEKASVFKIIRLHLDATLFFLLYSFLSIERKKERGRWRKEENRVMAIRTRNTVYHDC